MAATCAEVGEVMPRKALRPPASAERTKATKGPFRVTRCDIGNVARIGVVGREGNVVAMFNEVTDRARNAAADFCARLNESTRQCEKDEDR